MHFVNFKNWYIIHGEKDNVKLKNSFDGLYVLLISISCSHYHSQVNWRSQEGENAEMKGAATVVHKLIVGCFETRCLRFQLVKDGARLCSKVAWKLTLQLTLTIVWVVHLKRLWTVSFFFFFFWEWTVSFKAWRFTAWLFRSLLHIKTDHEINETIKRKGQLLHEFPKREAGENGPWVLWNTNDCWLNIIEKGLSFPL